MFAAAESAALLQDLLPALVNDSREQVLHAATADEALRLACVGALVAAVDGRIPMIADYSSIYRLCRTGNL